MGLRFRRRIKILPGIYVNASLSGLSLTAGVPGASVSLGRRGTYVNVGVPGTGLSYRQRIDQIGAPRRAPARHAPQTAAPQPRHLQSQVELTALAEDPPTLHVPDGES